MQYVLFKWSHCKSRKNTKKILMLGDPTQLPFITFFSGVVIFISIMFLLAFPELRKPKDAGSRKTEENVVSSENHVQLGFHSARVIRSIMG